MEVQKSNCVMIMVQVRFITASLILCCSHWHRDRASAFTPTYRRPTTSLLLHNRYDRTNTALHAIPPPHSVNELHLLTFDLDDTIFPIGPVVADANVAQLQALVKFGYDNACNKEIIAASKQIRTELREAGSAITYSDLRKQSIRREIERLTDESESSGVHGSVIETVFDAWLSERHASADRNLFPHASNALEQIKEQHPNAVIGAITNGRGNPLEMPSVSSYFDFCVSGEDEGVFPNRKPDKGIYHAAIHRYNEMIQEEGDSMQQQQQQEEFSINWIHVGDDLANDVGASAAAGAKTIWFTSEEEGEEPSELPSWSTATKEELQKRAALDEKAREYVSAKICSLDELPDAIVDIILSL